MSGLQIQDAKYNLRNLGGRHKMALQRKDLLGLKGVTAEEIKEILDTAAPVSYTHLLRL